MLHLLKNPDLALRMGETGKKIARDYDWSIITQRYLKTYRMAMKNKIKNQDRTGQATLTQ
jgi:glycosyltransferase involved in cell wall biosynthesis